MKGSSCSLVASVFAASTAALASTSSVAGEISFSPCCSELEMHRSPSSKPMDSNPGGVAGKEKFAPRFDGLRFIETLVTGHR